MNFYRDYNTLLYSMRSVYHYAPYIKNWYLITYDQIPEFIKSPYEEKSFTSDCYVCLLDYGFRHGSRQGKRRCAARQEDASDEHDYL